MVELSAFNGKDVRSVLTKPTYMVLIAEWSKALVCGTSIRKDFASSNLVHHPIFPYGVVITRLVLVQKSSV